LSIINATLLCDGTSDICLADISSLIIDEHFPNLVFRLNIARELIPARMPLADRLAKTLELYSPNLIICHRDAESESWNQRLREINAAHTLSSIEIPIIMAIPVRMIESWLLCDERSIRAAANNKNGDHPIDFPVTNRIENIQDPKEKLFSILRSASNLSARRMQKFDVYSARKRISSHLDSITPLRALPSFAAFERKFIEVIENLQASQN